MSTYDRISMYTEGRAIGMWAENIASSSNNGVEVVALMAVDDGDEKRKRREIMLDPAHKLVGIAHGAHIFTEYVSVIDYCMEFIDGEELSLMRRGGLEYFAEEESEESKESAAKGGYQFSKVWRHLM